MSASFRRGLVAAAATTAALTVSTLPAGAYLGQDHRPEQGTDRTGVRGSHVVTLVTGDVVTIRELGDGSTAASIDQRSSTGGVQTQTVGGDLYVIPDVAQPYLAADRLDRALFNVTKLIEQGYDDESAGALPLIAMYAPAVQTSKGRRAPAGSTKARDLASIDSAALETDRDETSRFWNAITPESAGSSLRVARFTNGIKKLWLDGRVEPELADSVPQIGAPIAWAQGFDGTGATVAVLDTGADATHPDLVDSIEETESFVPGDDDAGSDENGHGTHVASIVAGSGAASGGLLKGVAPGAELLVGKVLDDNGSGQESWVIDGMEWASEVEHADVVNLSLGDSVPSQGTDPLSQALNELTDETGTLFVVAAGNNYSEFSIGSPGAADSALTVAAVDVLDQRASFSSMGPRFGDFALKPDISAPGVDVVAARSQQIPFGEGWYQPMDGTSMAAPHVSGAAAILVGKRPTWIAPELKNALMSSAEPLPGTTPYEVGTGRVDVPASLDDVHATGSAYLGFFSWPHDGDPPVSRTLTYSNAGDAPVTLSLEDEVTGPDGQPVTDLVALSPQQVTVPAGGSTQVTMTADADAVDAVGRYTGFVVATDASGAVRARTAVGLVKEEERYTLNISAVDRAGAPASGFVTLYRYGSDYPLWLQLDPATGRAEPQRVEPGIYNLTTWMDVRGNGPDSAGIALLGNPHLVVSDDQDVVLDARRANRVSVRTPLRSEDRYRRVQYYHDTGIGGWAGTFSNMYFVPGGVDDIFAAPTGVVPGEAFDFAVRWRRSAPLLHMWARIPNRVVPVAPLYQLGSARLDGRVGLAAVEAGTGTAGEYDGIDARGKAVFITRSDDVQFFDRADAATAAGAALLVVVNDRPGKLWEPAGSADVPVVSLTRAQGEPLLARAAAGQLTLRGEAVASPAYMYDLVFNDTRGIPANLSYAPRRSELAQIDHRFIDDEPRPAYEARSDCRSYLEPPCWGPYEPVETGSTRTDYVSTQPGVAWYQEVFHSDGWDQRHKLTTYRPGQHTRLDWLAPITRPRLGEGFWGPYRDADGLSVNVPFASGGDGVTGSIWEPGGFVTSRLYHDGDLLAEQPYQAVFAFAPTGDAAQYRFEQDTERPSDLWRTSTRTHSAWTFMSERPDEGTLAPLPMLQLDYAVDTDLTGHVRRGGTNVIGFSAAHEPGAVGGGRVEGGTLELSYDDGATWVAARLRPTRGGGWEARVRYPRSASFVSLRGSAWDDAGNRVNQEIIRAYRLR